jgi:hypothetical protein
MEILPASGVDTSCTRACTRTSLSQTMRLPSLLRLLMMQERLSAHSSRTVFTLSCTSPLLPASGPDIIRSCVSQNPSRAKTGVRREGWLLLSLDMGTYYGKQVRFTAQQGQGDALTRSLLAGADLLLTDAGCLLFVVSRVLDDPCKGRYASGQCAGLKVVRLRRLPGVVPGVSCGVGLRGTVVG